MASKIADRYLGPALVPCIMFINLYKQLNHNNLVDPLYPTVAMGVVISAISTTIQYKLKKLQLTRFQDTLITAFIMTTIATLAMSGFNMMRLMPSGISYSIPSNLIQGNKNPMTLKDFVRYHLFVDITPAILILIQTVFSIILMHGLCHKAKRRFTFGEASIVSQLVSAVLLVYMLTFYSQITGIGPYQVSLTNEIILQVGIPLFFITFLPAYIMNIGSNYLALSSLICLSLAISYNSIQRTISAESDLDPLTWFAAHLFEKHQRISLFSIWISTVTGCISLSASWARLIGQTNSLIRKTFHIAICIVFITGYNQDLDFTRFAAGGILCLMFLFEMLRAWDMKIIGPHLENVCRSLRGKWDNRYLTLSHMYLLVGGFIPLWLLPGNASKLVLSSGLISVGVGDTAAAMVGTIMGRTRIARNSEKTMEGFLGNLIAMFLFKQIWIGNQDFEIELGFLMTALVTAIFEVVTTNCDNLILPLVMVLCNLIFQSDNGKY